LRPITFPSVVTVFFLIGSASYAQDAAVWSGTWNLDTGKSSCVGTASAASSTAVITEESGRTHQIVDFKGTDGTNTHLDFTVAPDGNSVPVSGAPDYVDTVKMTEPKPGHRHLVFSKAGKRVEWDKFVMGKDGKHLYVRLAGIDAGKSWKCRGVSVRQ